MKYAREIEDDKMESGWVWVASLHIPHDMDPLLNKPTSSKTLLFSVSACKDNPYDSYYNPIKRNVIELNNRENTVTFASEIRQEVLDAESEMHQMWGKLVENQNKNYDQDIARIELRRSLYNASLSAFRSFKIREITE